MLQLRRSYILSIIASTYLIVVSQDKRTPLHYAVIGNKTDCVLHLLRAGANPDLGDEAGYGTDISIYSANAFPENLLYEVIKDYAGKLLEKCSMCWRQSFFHDEYSPFFYAKCLITASA